MNMKKRSPRRRREVMKIENNILKLKKRFPDGFKVSDSINRDKEDK